MLKVLGFIVRRPDLDRAAFRHHYETRHAPLALRDIRVFAKYVRNHVIAGTPHDPPFDALSEFWYDDAGAIEWVTQWLASPAAAALLEDEARFMDRPRNAACAVTERLLHGPARPVEPGPVHKRGLLLTRSASVAPERFAGAVQAFCDALVQRNARALERASLDLPADPPRASLPAHAVVWLWPAAGGGALDLPEIAAPIASLATVRFEAIETPPARLRN